MARARSDKLLVHAAGSSWDWLRLGRGGQVRDSGQCDPAAADWPQESAATVFIDAGLCMGLRSEERRVGKEIRTCTTSDDVMDKQADYVSLCIDREREYLMMH